MSKKSTHIQFLSLVLGAFLMTAMISCTDEGGHSVSKTTSNQLEEPQIEGRYEVTFSPLNSSVSGITSGMAKIRIIADKISVSVEITDSPSKAIHSQLIYTATECPTEVHDTNNDGFIDQVEASKVLGSILIPLDGDLNSQEQGEAHFPWSDGLGNYSYYQEGEFSNMLADLNAPDLNLQDQIIKLIPGHDLKLEGKVIVIEGVSPDDYLPGSIQSIGSNSDRKSLPIACGVINRSVLEDSETTSGEEDV